MWLKILRMHLFGSIVTLILIQGALGELGAKNDRPACENFYSFVCTNLADEKKDTRPKIDKIMENPQKNRALKSVRNFYHACMKKETVTDEDMDTLKKIIEKIGGWHIFKNSVVPADQTYAQSLIYNLQALGFKTFWHINYRPSQLHGINQEVWMNPRETMFEYDDKGNRLDYVPIKTFCNQMIVKISMLGVEEATAKAVMDDVLYIDGLVAKAVANGISTNSTYIRELQYSMINWTDFFTHMAPSHLQVNSNFTKIFYSPSYMGSINSILQTKSEIQKHVNYLFARFIDDIFSLIHIRPGSARKCWYFIHSKLPLATDALIVRKYFTPGMQERATKLAESIRNHTIFEIYQYPIPQDEELKMKMMSKIKNTPIAVGYPEEFFDDTKIEEFYKNLEMNEDDFIGDLLNYTNYRYEQLTKRRPQSLEQSWIKYPRALEKIQPFKESLPIGIPANILRTDYYNENQSMYLNYAGMGRDIADKLIQMALTGLESHLQPMKQLIQCQTEHLVKRYFKEMPKELKKLLHKVAREPHRNLYDRLSLRSSYAAYGEWLTSNMDVHTHGDRNLSSKQNFWVRAMQLHCEKHHHTSPLTHFEKFSNFIDLPEFRRDFECPYVFENVKCKLGKEVSASKSSGQ